MGFGETYGYILSYFGIGLLGLGIAISLCVIVPACYWLFTSLSATGGPVVFRRLLVMLAVIIVSSSYLGSDTLYDTAGWWKTTFSVALITGCAVPVLRIDLVRLERREDRVLAIISGVWWSLLVFSEALLVSGVHNQMAILYLFVAVAGILCGGILGTTFARTARQRTTQPPGTGERQWQR